MGGIGHLGLHSGYGKGFGREDARFGSSLEDTAFDVIGLGGEYLAEQAKSTTFKLDDESSDEEVFEAPIR